MRVVMITGGIGSGKSTLRRLLCEKGAVSIDLDAIARTLMDNEPAVAVALADEFGPQILDEEGAVIRSELARAAFSSAAATRSMFISWNAGAMSWAPTGMWESSPRPTGTLMPPLPAMLMEMVYRSVAYMVAGSEIWPKENAVCGATGARMQSTVS